MSRAFAANNDQNAEMLQKMLAQHIFYIKDYSVFILAFY